jgi:hypothetical protein
LVRPPHIRGTDRIGAVLLDVGVHALVDEAALLVVDIFAGPGAEQIIVEAGRQEEQPSGVDQCSSCMTCGISLSCFFEDQLAHVVMAEAGALAHRLDGALAGIFVAEREREQAFDKAVHDPHEALALVRRRTASSVVAPSRWPGDLALAHAVAAADFRRVRQRCNGGVRVPRAASLGVGLTEDQAVADVGDILAAFQKVEIPVAVAGIAVEHRADQPVVLETSRL